MTHVRGICLVTVLWTRWDLVDRLVAVKRWQTKLVILAVWSDNGWRDKVTVRVVAEKI